MQTINIIINHKRKSFAVHSLKTKNVNRISPPSVFLSTPQCILFIFNPVVPIRRGGPETNRSFLSLLPNRGAFAFEPPLGKGFKIPLLGGVVSALVRRGGTGWARYIQQHLSPRLQNTTGIRESFNIFNLKFNICNLK